MCYTSLHFWRHTAVDDIFGSIMTRREDILNSEYFQKLAELQTQLGYRFKQSDLLLSALIHKSFQNEKPNTFNFKETNNERLEFLGDALLDYSISELLFQRHPSASEGELSKLRSSLVNEDVLSQLAKLLKLDQLILLGRGEQKRANHLNGSILANTFEAILGAISQEASVEVVKAVVAKLYQELSLSQSVDLLAIEQLNQIDAKSKLQEICHQLNNQTPTYTAIEIGSGSELIFEVSLVIADQVVAHTTAKSKKNAEKELAKLALDKKLYITHASEVKHVN
jgi:ribonuclease III